MDDEQVDGPFSTRYSAPENLQIELFQSYCSWGSGNSGLEEYYEHAQEFRGEVESFLNGHDVYDVAFNSVSARRGTFYEVWVLYEGDGS